MFFVDSTRRWKTMRRLAVLAAVFSWAAFAKQAEAGPGQGVLYGTSGNPSSFGSVDPATGDITEIGPTNAGAVPSLAVNSVGTIYAGGGAGNPTLYTINPATGNATPVGPALIGGSIGGMDFDDADVLYASLNVFGGGQTGSDTLVTINTSNGAATEIGSFGSCSAGSCSIDGIESLAFDKLGTLWAAKTARGAAGAPGLYTINTSNGQATFVRALVVPATGLPPSGGLSSLQYGCDNVLYGGTARAMPGETDGGQLVTVDPTTGITAFVGGAAIPDGTSMASLGFEISNCAAAQPPPPQNLYGCCMGDFVETGSIPASCGVVDCTANPAPPLTHPLTPYIWPNRISPANSTSGDGANDATIFLRTNGTWIADLYYTGGPTPPDPDSEPCRSETTDAGDLTCGFEATVAVTGNARIDNFAADAAFDVSDSLSADGKLLRLVSSRALDPIPHGVHRLGALTLNVTDRTGVQVTVSGLAVSANGDGQTPPPGSPLTLEPRNVGWLTLYVPEPSAWLQLPSALLGLALLARLRRRRSG